MTRIALFNLQRMPNPDYPNMAAGLRERGHSVYLGSLDEAGNLAWDDGAGVTAVQPGPLPEDAQVGGMRRRLAYAQFWGRVRSFLRRLRPDIVQMDPGVTFSPWLLPQRMPPDMRFIFDIKQINVGVRSDAVGRFKEWQMVRSWWYSGRYVYDHTLFDYGLAAEAVMGPQWQRWSTVVPVGINPELLEVPRPAPRPTGSDAPLRFIYIGSLSRFRELERLLEAAQAVAQQNGRFHIDFVGPDKSDGYYQGLIRDLGLADRVSFKPPVPYADIPQLIAGYDVGLAYNPDRLTWHYQPTIKVKEYRAVGLPILSTAVTSHRDFVEEGVNGLLVENTAQAWANGMLRFIEDASFFERTDRNARIMRCGITIAEVAEMHERVYRALGVDV